MFHVQRFDSFRTLNFELGTLNFRTTAALPSDRLACLELASRLNDNRLSDYPDSGSGGIQTSILLGAAN